MVVGMGFATNVLSLPALLGPGVLALSDESNHASLILGLRMSRATVRVFRHNDVRHAERLATAAIAEGKWKKIVIVSNFTFRSSALGQKASSARCHYFKCNPNKSVLSLQI